MHVLEAILLKRRQVKKEIFRLLEQYEPAELQPQLTKYPRTQVVGSLFMALCDTNERVRLHAVSCFGELVSALAREDADAARVIMRRFLWTLNDESGGIGWGAPEAMAQIMCKSEMLRREYLHMLISYMQEDGDELYQDGNFLELPLIQRGVLWGIGTLCYSFPEEMRERGLQTDIENYLISGDMEVRKLALWALVGLGVTYPGDFLEKFRKEGEYLRIFKDDIFTEVKINTLCDQLAA